MGIMANPFDTEAIADGLMRLKENSALRSKLIEIGLDRVTQFSWDKTAKLTLKILQDFAI